MKQLKFCTLFIGALLSATSAFALDCTLPTTTGSITWAHGAYTPVDAGRGTEQWLCVSGHIYRPYRATAPARPHQEAPATEQYGCAAYTAPYYRNHTNEIPSACMSDGERANHQYNSVDRNL